MCKHVVDPDHPEDWCDQCLIRYIDTLDMVEEEETDSLPPPVQLPLI